MWICWALRCCGRTSARRKTTGPRPDHPEALGLRHLAFRVEDVEREAAALNEKGIATEPIRLDSYSQKRFTFFRDPDGLPLELHE